MCKDDCDFKKYGNLLPSDYEDPVKIGEIRAEAIDSKCAKKVWQLINKWKLKLLLRNKKSYYFGWCKMDGKAGTLDV